ncbi:O-antigen ligase family protein [Nocardioides sp. 1609]|uniref:O-antigen ligase family protein n=1 Tax=Nocardioides sp. 1609 TaxID=2508327 RepID=UPI00106FF9C2|nr:O-antigen ligase family protein [Nocardioides sp. 1609]
MTLTTDLPGSHSGDDRSSPRPLVGARLPAWPLVAMFVPFPLWWFLGLADLVWIVLAVPMAAYLGVQRRVLVPVGFGLWLVFLLFVAASATRVEPTFGNLVEYGYRSSVYLACTVVLVYVFNARHTIGERLVAACLSAYWLTTVAGGYLGVLHPEGELRTPLYYVLSRVGGGLVSNDLVNHMVVRRFTQYSPTSFLDIAPRPSAPFLFTNNWGSVYSLILPVVVAYLLGARRRGPWWWLLAVSVPVSLVPAFLTLNRGMFIGLGLAMVYCAVRLAVQGKVRALLALVAIGVVAAGVFLALPVQERLDTRLQADGTSTRASLYDRSLEAVPGSPWIGYGLPIPSENPNEPAIGTQGQFWMILVSNGVIATAAFILFFLWAFVVSMRRTDALGLALNAMMLVSVVELAYYGVVPYGLPVMVVGAAVLLRSPGAAPVTGSPAGPGDRGPDAVPGATR